MLNELIKSRLSSLTAASVELGRDRLLIQASGGNTSEKIDGVLWVKASGRMLMEAEKEWLFVPVDLKAVRQAIQSGRGDKIDDCVLERTDLRPSIETTLHALLPHPVVLHVHSVNTITWAVREDGKSHIANLLDGLHWSWIPYRRPGLPLTEAVQQAALESPDVLVLQNHGLVVGGSDVVAAMALLHDVESRLQCPVRKTPEANLEALTPFLDQGDFRLPKDEIIHALATDPICLAAAKGGVPYPDHVVFLAPAPLVVSDMPMYRQNKDAYGQQMGADAAAVLVDKAGVVVRKDISFGAEEMLLCQVNVFLRENENTAIHYLSDDDVAALLNWDAEKYRLSLTG